MCGLLRTKGNMEATNQTKSASVASYFRGKKESKKKIQKEKKTTPRERDRDEAIDFFFLQKRRLTILLSEVTRIEWGTWGVGGSVHSVPVAV